MRSRIRLKNQRNFRKTNKRFNKSKTRNIINKNRRFNKSRNLRKRASKGGFKQSRKNRKRRITRKRGGDGDCKKPEPDCFKIQPISKTHSLQDLFDEITGKMIEQSIYGHPRSPAEITYKEKIYRVKNDKGKLVNKSLFKVEGILRKSGNAENEQAVFSGEGQAINFTTISLFALFKLITNPKQYSTFDRSRFNLPLINEENYKKLEAMTNEELLTYIKETIDKVIKDKIHLKNCIKILYIVQFVIENSSDNKMGALNVAITFFLFLELQLKKKPPDVNYETTKPGILTIIYDKLLQDIIDYLNTKISTLPDFAFVCKGRFADSNIQNSCGKLMKTCDERTFTFSKNNSSPGIKIKVEKKETVVKELDVNSSNKNIEECNDVCIKGLNNDIYTKVLKIKISDSENVHIAVSEENFNKILKDFVTQDSVTQDSVTPDFFNKDKINKLLEKVQTETRGGISINKPEIELGDGQGGVVYKGLYKTKVGIAVKTLKKSAQQKDLDDLQKESAIISLLDHKNIVKLLGVSVFNTFDIKVGLEYCTNGSLLDKLEKKNKVILDQNKIQYMINIADGLIYLISCGIIHCDLAARNILINSKDTAKISDFGYAKFLGDDCDRVKLTGNEFKKFLGITAPVRWWSPYSIKTREVNYKNDIWSFGVTMWEIMNNGKLPYEEIEDNQEVIAYKMNYTLYNLKKYSIPDELYNIIETCWSNQTIDTSPNIDELRKNLVSYYTANYEPQKNFYECLPIIKNLNKKAFERKCSLEDVTEKKHLIPKNLYPLNFKTYYTSDEFSEINRLGLIAQLREKDLTYVDISDDEELLRERLLFYEYVINYIKIESKKLNLIELNTLVTTNKDVYNSYLNLSILIEILKMIKETQITFYSETLKDEPYFKENITRNQAETEIKEKDIGSFIVRTSTTGGNPKIVLTVKTSNETTGIEHLIIYEYNKGYNFGKEMSNVEGDLKNFIQHYTENNLPDMEVTLKSSDLFNTMKDNIKDEPYFKGNITRDKAETEIKEKEIGSFIVRTSTTGGNPKIVLTVKTPNETTGIEHLIIYKYNKGYNFGKETSNVEGDLKNFIRHYTENNLPDTEVTLKMPNN